MSDQSIVDSFIEFSEEKIKINEIEMKNQQTQVLKKKEKKSYENLSSIKTKAISKKFYQKDRNLFLTPSLNSEKPEYNNFDKNNIFKDEKLDIKEKDFFLLNSENLNKFKTEEKNNYISKDIEKSESSEDFKMKISLSQNDLNHETISLIKNYTTDINDFNPNKGIKWCSIPKEKNNNKNQNNKQKINPDYYYDKYLKAKNKKENILEEKFELLKEVQINLANQKNKDTNLNLDNDNFPDKSEIYIDNINNKIVKNIIIEENLDFEKKILNTEKDSMNLSNEFLKNSLNKKNKNIIESDFSSLYKNKDIISEDKIIKEFEIFENGKKDIDLKIVDSNNNIDLDEERKKMKKNRKIYKNKSSDVYLKKVNREKNIIKDSSENDIQNNLVQKYNGDENIKKNNIFNNSILKKNSFGEQKNEELLLPTLNENFINKQSNILMNVDKYENFEINKFSLNEGEIDIRSSGSNEYNYFNGNYNEENNEKLENSQNKVSSNIPTNINNGIVTYKTTQSNFKDICSILSKRKSERSKPEIKYLIKFLTSKFRFFNQLSQNNELNSHIKLDACAVALNIQYFEEGQIVFNCGEVANTFYIVLQGKVRVIKPILIEKEMSFKAFVEYLFYVKNVEKNEIKLDRIQQANSNNINLSHIKRYNYEVSKFSNDNYQKKFFIEEANLLDHIKEGGEFGEIGIMYDCRRTATIQAETKCTIAFIERNEYNRAYYELEEKDQTSKILEFKNTYNAFGDLRRGLVYKLLNFVETKEVSIGENIYEQGSVSDCIYMSIEGTYDIISCISLRDYKKFLEYVNNQKNSLLSIMKKNKIILDSDFEEMRKNSDELYGLPPTNFSRDNHILALEARTKTQNPLDIKMKEEILKNTSHPIHVLIKTLEKPDVIGLEEALELKRRFYTVKCTSIRGILYKIDLKTFFNLINKEEISKSKFNEFIMERKKRLFSQVHKSIILKHKTLNIHLSHNYDSIFNKIENTEKRDNKKNSKIAILHNELRRDNVLIENFKNESNNKNLSCERLYEEEKETLQKHKRCLTSNFKQIKERNKNFPKTGIDINFQKKDDNNFKIRNINSANSFTTQKKKQLTVNKQSVDEIKFIIEDNQKNFLEIDKIKKINEKEKSQEKKMFYIKENKKNQIDKISIQDNINDTDKNLENKKYKTDSNNNYIKNDNDEYIRTCEEINKLKAYYDEEENKNLKNNHKYHENLFCKLNDKNKQFNSYLKNTTCSKFDNNCNESQKNENKIILQNNISLDHPNNLNSEKCNLEDRIKYCNQDSKLNHDNNNSISKNKRIINNNYENNVNINEYRKNNKSNSSSNIFQKKSELVSKIVINKNCIQNNLLQKIKNKIILTKTNINSFNKRNSKRTKSIGNNNINNINIFKRLQPNNDDKFQSNQKEKLIKSKSHKKLKITEKFIFDEKENFIYSNEKEKSRIDENNLNLDLKNFHPEIFSTSINSKFNLINNLNHEIENNFGNDNNNIHKNIYENKNESIIPLNENIIIINENKTKTIEMNKYYQRKPYINDEDKSKLGDCLENISNKEIDDCFIKYTNYINNKTKLLNDNSNYMKENYYILANTNKNIKAINLFSIDNICQTKISKLNNINLFDNININYNENISKHSIYILNEKENENQIRSKVDLYDELNKELDSQFNPKTEKTRIKFSFSAFSNKHKNSSNLRYKSTKNKNNFSTNLLKNPKTKKKKTLANSKNYENLILNSNENIKGDIKKRFKNPKIKGIESKIDFFEENQKFELKCKESNTNIVNTEYYKPIKPEIPLDSSIPRKIEINNEGIIDFLNDENDNKNIFCNELGRKTLNEIDPGPFNKIEKKSKKDQDKNISYSSYQITDYGKYINTNEKPFIPLFNFDSQKYSEDIKKKSFNEIRQEISRLTGIQFLQKSNLNSKKIFSEQQAKLLLKINPYVNDEYLILDKIKFNNKNYNESNLINKKNKSIMYNSAEKDININRSRNLNNLSSISAIKRSPMLHEKSQIKKSFVEIKNLENEDKSKETNNKFINNKINNIRENNLIQNNRKIIKVKNSKIYLYNENVNKDKNLFENIRIKDNLISSFEEESQIISRTKIKKTNNRVSNDYFYRNNKSKYKRKDSKKAKSLKNNEINILNFEHLNEIKSKMNESENISENMENGGLKEILYCNKSEVNSEQQSFIHSKFLGEQKYSILNNKNFSHSKINENDFNNQSGIIKQNLDMNSYNSNNLHFNKNNPFFGKIMSNYDKNRANQKILENKNFENLSTVSILNKNKYNSHNNDKNSDIGIYNFDKNKLLTSNKNKLLDRRKTKISVQVQMKYFKMLKKQK